MSDQPPTPNLAELFTNLLNFADANTRAAILSVLQTQPQTNNLHVHSYVDDIAASTYSTTVNNPAILVPINNTPTPQTPLATNNTTNPTTPLATNITTGSTTSISTNLDYDDPEDNFILSQSKVAPRIHNTHIHSTNHIILSSGLFTTLLEDQLAAHDDDLQLQTRRMTEGRVYNYNDAHIRKHIIIKIAINTTANSDQAPTTSILEEVINTIIPSPYHFPSTSSPSSTTPNQSTTLNVHQARITALHSSPHAPPQNAITTSTVWNTLTYMPDWPTFSKAPPKLSTTSPTSPPSPNSSTSSHPTSIP
jgi:hypothetical protein